MGPFTIVHTHGNGTLTIQRTPHITDRVNIQQVKPYFCNPWLASLKKCESAVLRIQHYLVHSLHSILPLFGSFPLSRIKLFKSWYYRSTRILHTSPTSKNNHEAERHYKYICTLPFHRLHDQPLHAATSCSGCRSCRLAANPYANNRYYYFCLQC
jgi:hypothetical protein